MMRANLYAIDGKCHNSQPGTFGHECGKPAPWLGRKGSFVSGFCDGCKADGWEARGVAEWRRRSPALQVIADRLAVLQAEWEVVYWRGRDAQAAGRFAEWGAFSDQGRAIHEARGAIAESVNLEWEGV